MKLACSKCRKHLIYRIARGKNDKDDYRDVSVIKKVQEGKYECVCNRCKHTWISISKAAQLQSTKQLPSSPLD
jgi:hypothetical protein